MKGCRAYSLAFRVQEFRVSGAEDKVVKKSHAIGACARGRNNEDGDASSSDAFCEFAGCVLGFPADVVTYTA